MKNVFIAMLTVVAMAFTSCGGNEDTPTNKTKGKLDPDAVILIKPADGVRSGNSEFLSAKEIVKQGVAMGFYSIYFDGKLQSKALKIGRGFAEAQRDTTVPALKMWATDIIAQNGEFMRDFLYATDVVIWNDNHDTIAYIPNAVLMKARVDIEKAWNDSNFVEVYRLFDEAYTFKPINGKIWKELKNAGQN